MNSLLDRIRSEKGKEVLALFLLLYLVGAVFILQHPQQPVSDGRMYYIYTKSLALDFDIDLSNEENYSYPKWITSAGRVGNIFPLGTGILLVPFFVAGHILSLLLNLLGFGVPTAGEGVVYYKAAALGILFYGVLAVITGYVFCRRYYGRNVSFIAAAFIFFGTNFFEYSSNCEIFSHAPAAFFFAAFATCYAARFNEFRDSVRPYLVLGVWAGLMGLVRTENLVALAVLGPHFVFLAVQAIARKDYATLRRVLAGSLCFFAALVLCFSPQLFAWKYMFGTWTIHRGDLYWRDPYLLAVLNSSRNGLIAWAPLFGFAVLGLFVFLRDHLKQAALLIACFLPIYYVHCIVVDWYGGLSFGNRRLLVGLVVFQVGLAALCRFVWAHRRAAGWAVLAFLLVSVFFFQRNIARNRPGNGAEAGMAGVYANALSWEWADVYRAVGNPFSWPASLYYRLAYGVPLCRYDFIMGEHQPSLVDFQHDPYLHRFLLDGFEMPPEAQSAICAFPTNKIVADQASFLIHLHYGQKRSLPPRNLVYFQFFCRGDAQLPVRLFLGDTPLGDEFTLRQGLNIRVDPLSLPPHGPEIQRFHIRFRATGEQIRQADVRLLGWGLAPSLQDIKPIAE